MPTGLKSLVDAGTKLWLDSVDPEEVKKNIERGATGATSNPAIISQLMKSGRFDEHAKTLLEDANDHSVAWMMCDYLVGKAQRSSSRFGADAVQRRLGQLRARPAHRGSRPRLCRTTSG